MVIRNIINKALKKIIGIIRLYLNKLLYFPKLRISILQKEAKHESMKASNKVIKIFYIS